MLVMLAYLATLNYVINVTVDSRPEYYLSGTLLAFLSALMTSMNFY
jgi:hypothetical protein